MVWVNTVGPWYNPQESYPYYRLPFCVPDVVGTKSMRPSGLGEILAGNKLRDSGVDIKFKGERDPTAFFLFAAFAQHRYVNTKLGVLLARVSCTCAGDRLAMVVL